MSTRVTIEAPIATDRTTRYQPHRLLMCAPEHFDVVYDINPWMRATLASDLRVDRALALRQWESLVETYRELGHTVDLVDPEPGAADMVFAANAATVVDGLVYTARFRYDQRRAEEKPYRKWFEAAVDAKLLHDIREAEQVNEGEGDFALAGELLLAGHGFRTAHAAHTEASRFLGRTTLSLRLVDPRYYHLDTALTVLDDDLIAWYPLAFDPVSRAQLARRFPQSIVATPEDAAKLGLNMMSDGHHVVLPAGAHDLAAQLRSHGFEPVPVDLSELRKAGGSVKCCTLELRTPASVQGSP